MAKVYEVYRCNVCGNIVEVLHGGKGTLVCCGQDMELLVPKTADEGNEKHVPVIAQNGEEVIVKVGDIAHPMLEKHYIEWIEIIADGQSCRKFLQPGEAPQASFRTQAKNVVAREYCNIHGLWQSK